MSPVALAVRTGVRRGLTMCRHSLASGEDNGYRIFVNGVLLAVLLWQRGATVDGTALSLATLSLPGILGVTVAFNGIIGIAAQLAIEREDGTLLRAKAAPHGLVGYLTGLLVYLTLDLVLGLLIILVPGMLLLDGLSAGGPLGWLTLLWVLALGLLATLPWGAMMGSLISNPQKVFGWGFLGVGSIAAISGIFYPITALAGWVQGVAQVFPIYWLGLGMRASFLPDAAAAVEIGGSWRTLETIGVLGAWAVAGLLLAPGVLRRMARRESGSAVEVRRQAALQRIG